MHDKLSNKKVVFSVTNCICFDQRVLKMAETLQKMGAEILIVGRERGDCCKQNSIGFKTRRFRMFFQKGFLFYMFFNLRLFLFLLFKSSDILVSNDLDTLLPNYLVSKIKGVPLVYDSHEYFTHLPELTNRKFVTRVWTIIERMIFPRLNYVITVSNPIAAEYQQKYGVMPVVIRNLSKSSDNISAISKTDAGLNEDDFVLIIQGNGLNIDKGVEELVGAVSITEGVSLLIVGSGDVISSVKELVATNNLKERVKFIPSVSWKEMMRYTKCADIGLILEKDTNLNYRYSLPNKLFDYISGGIAVVAGKLPETSKIIEELKIGLLLEEVTKESISAAIIELKNDRKNLKVFTQNSKKASIKYNWENERGKVMELYSKIIPKEIH
jgi:glycosyltransferase involved in cell wall biosynthesis